MRFYKKIQAWLRRCAKKEKCSSWQMSVFIGWVGQRYDVCVGQGVSSYDMKFLGLWWSVTKQEDFDSKTPLFKKTPGKQENEYILLKAVYKHII